MNALISDGYLHIKNAIPTPFISDLYEYSTRILPTPSAKEKYRSLSIGQLINLEKHDYYLPLILHQAILTPFNQLNFHDIKFGNGYIVNKYPQSPASFWHNDWWQWQDPISYSDAIPQIGVLC